MANNIDIYQLWLDVNSNNNTKQGGHLRLRDFNNWVNQVSLELFNDYFGEWEKSQQISDKLSQPFLDSQVVIATKSKLNYSLFPYPENYAYFSSARIFKTSDDVVIACPKKDGEDSDSVLSDICEVGVKKIDNGRWGSVCSHPVIPPTLDRVFITQYNGGFKCAPKEVAYVSIDFLRYPKKAELAFDLTKLPNQVYDPVNTKPLEWHDTLRNEFISRISKAFGIFIREPFLYETSKQQQQSET